MAKKETTKKTIKKTTSKKTAPKKVNEEVETNIIENTEKVEVRPEVLEEIKKQKPIMETCSESEYMPTVKEVDEIIKEVEVINADPTVVIPSNEIEIDKDLTLEIERKAFRDTFKEVNNQKGRIDRSFGYSWNGMEMD